MTRRLPLWIAAAVVALGATTAAPPPSGAQLGSIGWTVTIDDHADVVDTRPVSVSGEATFLGALGVLAPVREVTIALVPGNGLPADACRVEPKKVAPSNGRYSTRITPRCNGPHTIRVTARTDSGPSPATTEAVKLAWVGTPPAPPTAVANASGALVRWAATAEPDVVSWTLAGGGTYPVATTQAQVAAPPGVRTFSLTAVRWGADGPGGPTVTSPPSGGATVTVPTPDPVDPPAAPSDDPPAAAPRTGGAPPAAGGSGPPAATGRTGPPTRGSGSNATLPEGYSEELPYGAPDDAFVPGEAPTDTGDEESAAGTSPSASLVRTSEKRSPGLVAPFALGLMMITVATHIAWYLRRSRPQGDGQVTPL